jgi:hypothetical protein
LGFSAEVRTEAERLSAKEAPGIRAASVKAREEVGGSGKKDGDLLTCWVRQSNKDFAAVADLAVVKFICGIGLSPYAADTEVFKEFIRELTCGRYTPKSGTTLTESHIASEAARIRELTIDYLRSDKVQYITYGFDAGAIKQRASFLTIHATDDSRRAHFLAAVDTSGQKHSAEFYISLILPVSALEASRFQRVTKS